MDASIRQRTRNPIIVNQDSLRDLDRRLRAVRPQVDTSEKRAGGSTETARTGRSARNVPPENAASDRTISRIASTKYTIKWTNNVTVNSVDIETALNLLDEEYSRPVEIKAEIGSYTNRPYLRIEIEDEFYHGTIIHADLNHSDVTNIKKSVIDWVKKSAPEYDVLYRHWLKNAMLFLVMCSTTFSLAYLSFELGRRWIVGQSGAALLYIFLVISLLWSVVYLYGRAFPTISWEFGEGKRQNSIRRALGGAFLAAITSIVIPWVFFPK